MDMGNKDDVVRVVIGQRKNQSAEAVVLKHLASRVMYAIRMDKMDVTKLGISVPIHGMPQKHVLRY
jgi:hypothetical protein